MKNFKSILMTVTTALFSAVMFLSCDNLGEETHEPASVAITVDKVSATSLTFTITPENAVSYSWACVKSSEADGAELELVESAEGKQYEVTGLEEDTEYTILAEATNAGGVVCELVSETAFTTSSPVVTINPVKIGATSAELGLSISNADKFFYANAKADAAAPEEFAELSGDESSISLAGLEPSTAYKLYYYAQNETDKLDVQAYEYTTGAMPSILFGDIIAQATSATVLYTCTDVDKLYYAVAGKGEAQPEDYTEIAITTENAEGSIVMDNLAEATAYVFYYYVENGYEKTEVTSVEFQTSKTPLSISVVPSITDADITIDFDTELYSAVEVYVEVKQYFSIENWLEHPDWFRFMKIESAGTYSASKDFTGGYLQNGPEYIVVAYPVDKDGTALTGEYISTTFVLEAPVIGDSEASLDINVRNVTSSSFEYSFTAKNGAVAYHFTVIPSSYAYDGMDKDLVLNYEKFSAFDAYNSEEKCSYNTSYSIVAVPVDADGKYGNAVIKEVTTSDLELTGTGEFTISDTCTPGLDRITFEATFGENTSKIYYYAFTDDDEKGYASKSDLEFVKAMLSGWDKKTIYSYSTSVNCTGLSQGTEYNLWFFSEDNSGNYSKLVKKKWSTKSMTTDGNAEFSIVSLSATGNSYGSYSVKIATEFGSNCSGLYCYKMSASQYDTMSDDMVALASSAVLNGNYKDTSSEFTFNFTTLDYVYVFVAVDNDGRYSEPVVRSVEEDEIIPYEGE